MKEIFAKINEIYASMKNDAEKQISSGNASAGRRARTSSLELEKMLKDFRKASLSETKK